MEVVVEGVAPHRVKPFVRVPRHQHVQRTLLCVGGLGWGGAGWVGLGWGGVDEHSCPRHGDMAPYGSRAPRLRLGTETAALGGGDKRGHPRASGAAEQRRAAATAAEVHARKHARTHA